jgi:hypothetical protein
VVAGAAKNFIFHRIALVANLVLYRKHPFLWFTKIFLQVHNAACYVNPICFEGKVCSNVFTLKRCFDNPDAGVHVYDCSCRKAEKNWKAKIQSRVVQLLQFRFITLTGNTYYDEIALSLISYFRHFVLVQHF